MHYCVLLTVLRLHSSLNTSLPLRYQALAEFIPIIVCHGLQMYFLDSDEEEISSDDDEANPTTPTEDALKYLIKYLIYKSRTGAGGSQSYGYHAGL